MAKESIRLIEEAEAAAYDEEIHAQAQAAEIVSEAKQRAINAHDEAVARAKEMAESTKRHISELADARLRASIAESEAAAGQLRKTAAEKIAGAVDAVIADIIN